MMDRVIYKVVSETEWQAAKSKGVFQGSAVDQKDGFIHFSRWHQVAGTLEKHFRGQTDLMLLAVDVSGFGAKLKYETSRGGDMFPHLYADLKLRCVIASWPLAINDDGSFELPVEFPFRAM